MTRRGGPVDVDAIVARVMARAGRTEVDAGILLDVARALLTVGRQDLAADWALRAYRHALQDADRERAAEALGLLVDGTGAPGRRALRGL